MMMLNISVIGISVPILTQSENWALYHGNLAIAPLDNCSNPHPVRKLGAIAVVDKEGYWYAVPILTQSENWALFIN